MHLMIGMSVVMKFRRFNARNKAMFATCWQFRLYLFIHNMRMWRNRYNQWRAWWCLLRVLSCTIVSGTTPHRPYSCRCCDATWVRHKSTSSDAD